MASCVVSQLEQGERNRNPKRNYQSIKKLITSPLRQEENGGSRGKTGRGCETVPRSL